MVSFPNCKINLGLSILDKRADGFHNIETCLYPLPFCDILEIIPSDEMSITTSGNIIPGREKDNLCLKAYHLLESNFDLSPVKIHLHKIIPTGAGVGGGSANAAFTIKMLNEIFDLKLSLDVQKKYATRLGSDCAFFLEGLPTLASGRGEVLMPSNVNLNGKFIVLLKPALHVSTAEAYARAIPKEHKHSIREIIDHEPFENWKNVLRNDFEDHIFKAYPLIEILRNKLYKSGATYASMSGSGSAVYGIFKFKIDLPEFADTICWSGVI